jgi:superfamily II DNA/RNA helicase
VPHDSEDYVHRIGRTARANNDGVAITFVSEKEQTQFAQIERFLDKEIYKIALPDGLGDAPVYAPKVKANNKRQGGRRNGGNRRKQNGGQKR